MIFLFEKEKSYSLQGFSDAACSLINNANLPETYPCHFLKKDNYLLE